MPIYPQATFDKGVVFNLHNHVGADTGAEISVQNRNQEQPVFIANSALAPTPEQMSDGGVKLGRWKQERYDVVPSRPALIEVTWAYSPEGEGRITVQTI